MDLKALEKNAILIPTPGQPEQEYLAQYLSQKGLFYQCRQDSFDIRTAINKCELFPGFKNNDLPGSFFSLPEVF
jgi:hypothetical protein